ncbi:unnamed protein product [Arabidopsis halleri]
MAGARARVQSVWVSTILWIRRVWLPFAWLKGSCSQRSEKSQTEKKGAKPQCIGLLGMEQIPWNR